MSNAAATVTDVRIVDLDYADHALGGGAAPTAVAYVETRHGNAVRWGVGTDPNIITASLRAVLNGVERQQR